MATCAELQSEKDSYVALSTALVAIIQADSAVVTAKQALVTVANANLTAAMQQMQTDQMSKMAADGMVTQITQQMQMQGC